MTAPETRYSTDARRVGAGPPTHWHTRIFGSVVGLGNSKTQLHQNKEGTGEYRGEEGGARQGPPHIHKHRFSIAKALRTNPENSVKEGGLCVPPTES